MNKKVLITGGAGGLGGVTSRLLMDNGWHVYVADFNQTLLDSFKGNDSCTPISLDVTSRQSVQQAYEQVSTSTTSLDAIINFAGILAVGSMVELDDTTVQRVLDVNVLGTFRVNRTFFPLVKKAPGRIVNISSETGWQSGAPFNGAYAMSKHAVEAYSDSLRRELALLDIPVIKIQPGAFKTNMVGTMEQSFRQAAQASGLFGNVLEKMIPFVIKEANSASDPMLLAEVILDALTVDSPKPAYSVRPARSRVLLEMMPTRLADYAFKSLMRQSG